MKRSFEEGSSSGRPIGKSPVLVPCTTKLRGGDDFEEEQQQKKKLYMFFNHPGGTYSHSLYAVEVPSDDVVPAAAGSTKVTTTTTTTTTIWGQVTDVRTDLEEETPREDIEPVLRFQRDAWPSNMSCASYGKKLFFVGGLYKSKSPTTNVYVLDLSTNSSLESYQDSPSQILEPAPKLESGKIRPLVFVVGHKLYVISGHKFNIFNDDEKEELHQLEFLDLASKNPKWKVGAAPPFLDCEIGPFTIMGDTVVIQAGQYRKPPHFYSYHLEEDRWDDFDTSSWSKLTRIQGFLFRPGTKCIGDSLFTTFTLTRDAIPVIVRLDKKQQVDDDHVAVDVDNFDDVDLPDSVFDVIKSTIECRLLSNTLVDLGVDLSTTGTRIAFLQAGNPLPDTDNPWEDFNGEETHISLSFFDIVNGRTATYVTSSHYRTRPGRTFINAGAHLLV